jgi:putative ATP-dependent endonuclease of OLD family
MFAVADWVERDSRCVDLRNRTGYDAARGGGATASAAASALLPLAHRRKATDMRIVRVRIRNFRCIREAEIFPADHNVLLGPNNVGKTAVLEAINLVLTPELLGRFVVVDENDFYNRLYAVSATTGDTESTDAGTSARVELPQTGQVDTPDSHEAAAPVIAYPVIRIEIVLAGLSEEDEDVFRDWLVPWHSAERRVIESAEDGTDPFAAADTAIRVAFEGWYDPDEDDFKYKTFFQRAEGMHRDDCPPFTKAHKRHIGFLIYRDFRALTRPITLDPSQLFSRLLYSQDVKPRHFEDALAVLSTSLEPMTHDADFISLLNAYKAELERFLILAESRPSALSFQVTDGTRAAVKSESQMYLRDSITLPVQKSGAGTRSLSTLAMLTLIMRRRGRGILALEEPETFLFPHAQRRVVDECLALASQTFVTTHSPFVLERIPIEGVGRIARDSSGAVTWTPIVANTAKAVNLYSRRLREACCEALLGRGVVVVEGDSDKWWVLGASRILNRKEWRARRQEALELLGVSVVSADTNSDAVRLGEFFRKAGLRVCAVLDRVPPDDPVLTEVAGAQFPCVFLREAGIEKLLSDRLPVDVLRRMLTEAEHSKTPLLNPAEGAAMAEAEVRDKGFEVLRSNKGSAGLHEWLLSLLDENSLPSPLKDLIDCVSLYMAGAKELGTCSLTE